MLVQGRSIVISDDYSHTHTHTPWFVLNTLIRRDPQTPAVEEEISSYSSLLSAHPNDLVVTSWRNPTTGDCENICLLDS
jgi:hypothetical protein